MYGHLCFMAGQASHVQAFAELPMNLRSSSQLLVDGAANLPIFRRATE
jgi:hypothetical protein